jgi:uncharacterized protein (TIGR02453 family)
MTSRFPGFPREGLQFLSDLARNNHRDWFRPRKPIYEQAVKRPMCELVEALNAGMTRFAPDYITGADQAIYRIYRDTRFSPDKTPYKDHIAASFRHRRLACSEGGAGYYFAVSHKEVAIGGGVYQPSPETLLAVRNYIAERHEEFRRILKSRAVRRLLGELQGERLTRAPKGFSPQHPASDLLRYKQFVLYIELAPAIAATPRLYTEVAKRFQTMTAFLEFLNAPLLGRRKKVETRNWLL